MRRRPSWLNILLLVFAVAQTGLSPVLSVLDARLAAYAQSSRAASHVESERSRDCPPAHDDACVICRHISQSVDVPHPDAAIVAWSERPTAVPEAEARDAAASDVALPPTRAPPSA